MPFETLQKFAAEDTQIVQCVGTTTEGAKHTLKSAQKGGHYVQSGLTKDCRLEENLMYKCATIHAPQVAHALQKIANLPGHHLATAPAFVNYGNCKRKTRCHFDDYSNVLIVLYGRKVFYVSRPSSIEHDADDGGQQHEALHVTPFNTTFEYRIELGAGDMLFLPPKWWHYVETPDETAMVNFFLEQDDAAVVTPRKHPSPHRCLRSRG